MTQGSNLLVAFVEGAATPLEFSQWLYSDPEAETSLCGATDLPRFAQASANLFHYLIQLDYRNPGEVLNAQDAVVWYLEKKGIPHARTATYADLHLALLKAQPRWLDVPPTYLDLLLNESGERSGKEMITWLKRAITERFRFLKTPPKWLQSPQWMFKGDRPLMFIGQLDISALGHDMQQLYVFFDSETQSFNFVTQSA